MTITNLQELLVAHLKDAHSVESQIIDALPSMIEKSTDDRLRQALTDHLAVTREQLKRLDQVSEIITFSGSHTVCKGMKGILAEAKSTLEMVEGAPATDASIISLAQRVEHYEIAVYGSAAQYARQLEMSQVADLLEQTLAEEEAADGTLSDLAEGGLFRAGLNEQAIEDEGRM